MFRWMRLLCVLSLWFVVLAVARADTHRFNATVQADGITLGTASGTLEVLPKAERKVTWKVTDGQFSPASLPDGKVIWDEAILAGTGDAPSGDTITIKDFSVTVQKTSGVDVTYRFRLAAAMENGAIKDVTITQQT